MRNLLAFWAYVKETWEEDEIAAAAAANSFDLSRLQEENLQKLSENDIFGLFGTFVYIVFNELVGGDFETMYIILDEDLGFDYEFINMLMDF